MAGINRRQFLSGVVAALGYLSFARGTARRAEATSPQGSIPGLTVDDVGRYVQSLSYVNMRQEPMPGVARTYRWTSRTDRTQEFLQVVAEADEVGQIRRLEALSSGFGSGRWMEILAAIPYRGAEPDRARQWVRDNYEKGLPRWPQESTFKAQLGGMLYLGAGSFSSSGISTRLSITPPTR
ncbi:MAG: hypothetical protein EPO21_21335 [Chloroflexota bacterium]|nr:MAG: hypothetical protein EPO21_21335 [Chloroflexota bacterium]